jgi:hypothetical protein
VKWVTVQTHTVSGEYSLRDVECSLGITKGKLIRWQEGKSIGADEWALYEGDGSVWGSHAGVMVSVPAAPWELLRVITFSGVLSVHANNAEAISSGLNIGEVYRTSIGALMIVY